MPVAPELTYQQLSTVQGVTMPTPVTITAAATIAPTTFLTLITGTTSVATITPPILGTHALAITVLTTNFNGFASTGNIALASITNSTTWGTRPSLFVFNPITAVYYPLYGVTTTNS